MGRKRSKMVVSTDLNEVQFPKELQLHLGPLSAACLLDLNEVQFPKELQPRAATHWAPTAAPQ